VGLHKLPLAELEDMLAVAEQAVDAYPDRPRGSGFRTLVPARTVAETAASQRSRLLPASLRRTVHPGAGARQ
jgi:hypothetical protein